MEGGEITKEHIEKAIETKRWAATPETFEVYHTFMSLGVGRSTYRLRMSRQIPLSNIIEYSMEAFILLAVENVLEFVSDKVNKIEPRSPRRYTADSNKRNARKFSGWSEQGKERYNDLMEEILDDREDYSGKFDPLYRAWFNEKMDREADGNKKRKKTTTDSDQEVRVEFANPLLMRNKRLNPPSEVEIVGDVERAAAV